jgi:hypothetical protein
VTESANPNQHEPCDDKKNKRGMNDQYCIRQHKVEPLERCHGMDDGSACPG